MQQCQLPVQLAHQPTHLEPMQLELTPLALLPVLQQLQLPVPQQAR